MDVCFGSQLPACEQDEGPPEGPERTAYDRIARFIASLVPRTGPAEACCSPTADIEVAFGPERDALARELDEAGYLRTSAAQLTAGSGPETGAR